ncbi:hypothetical protein ES703_84033 [subsurface metagenome]
MTEVGQELVSGLALGQIHLREVEAAKLQLEVAHLGDTLGILQRLRNILIKRRHLLGALEVIEVAGHLYPLLVMDRGVGADAEQQVVGGSILLVDIVNVVGGDQRYIQFLAHRYQVLVDLLQLGNGMALYLQVEIAEGLLVPESGLLGFFEPPRKDKVRHLADDAGA